MLRAAAERLLERVVFGVSLLLSAVIVVVDDDAVDDLDDDDAHRSALLRQKSTPALSSLASQTPFCPLSRLG